LKSLLGLTAEVQVKAPGEVPRSQGKAVRVRDLRPKGWAGRRGSRNSVVLDDPELRATYFGVRTKDRANS